MEQPQRIFSLLMRHFDGLIRSLENNLHAIAPIFNINRYPDDPHEHLDAESWANGFMQGISLRRSDCQPLFDGVPGQTWLRPLHLPGADEVSDDEDLLVR